MKQLSYRLVCFRFCFVPRRPFRDSDSYVPAAYLAGERTTALAIDPECDGDRAVHPFP